MKGVGVHTRTAYTILPKVYYFHNDMCNDRVQGNSLLHQKGQLNSFN